MLGLFLHLISIGCASLNKFCSAIDLPPPVTPSCYNNILKRLSAHVPLEQANNIMKESSVKWGHLAHLDPNSTNTILSTNPVGSSNPL